MWQETNRIRSERGLPPVLLSSIISAEQQSLFHSDYSHQFALNCAEITEK
ncbi:hypothetical protein [Streptomyces noursei]